MTKRVQSLQSLRGIAFLLIFCSHCDFIQVFSSAWGGTGVSIFVILSGFVVTMGYDHANIRTDLKTIPYIKKRFMKIFPLHILVLMGRLLFDNYLGIKTSFIVILLNITMLKSFVPVQEIYYSLGGATWYLTLILVFALFTPLLLRVLHRIKKENGIILFVAILIFRIVWIYCWQGSTISQWQTYINPFFRLTDYFLGMMLGINIGKLKKLFYSKKQFGYFFEGIVWSLFIFYVVSLSVAKVPWYHIYVRTPLSLGLIILFCGNDWISNRMKKILYENKFLIYIGNISFELFLIHIQIRNIINYIFKKSQIDNDLMKLLVIFIVSILLAQLYCTVQYTINKNKRKVLR